MTPLWIRILMKWKFENEIWKDTISQYINSNENFSISHIAFHRTWKSGTTIMKILITVINRK